MKLISSLTIFFVIAILAGLLPNAFSLAAMQQPQEAYSYQVVCDLPRGENGVNYAGEGVPEMLTWGPTALAVGQDGSFWIADAAANRLLQVNADCSLAQVINLEGLTAVPSDLEVNGNNLWVLDAAAVTPAVHRLTLNGQGQWRRDIPAEAVEGLTGIALDGNGQLLVEREAGASLMQLSEGRSNGGSAVQAGYTYGGRSYQARPADLTAPDNNLGMLQFGDRQVEVRAANDLGGLYMLGFDRQGNPLFVVEEVAVAGEVIQVDQTVRKYDATGAFIGTARFPLAEQYSYVQHSLAIGPDGSLYGLLTHHAGARIIRLNFNSPLPAILPTEDSAQLTQANPLQPEAVDACISSSTILSNAAAYVNNSHYYSITNISGTCTLRTKPVYLTTAGTYSSVSYDWGGFDTVSAFNSYMSPGTYQAGDTDTSGSETCSRGVDCSGYVSRTWGLTTKYATSTLPNISWALPAVGSFVPGDIYNNPSSHVVLFRSFATNGANVYESTTSGYDRVIARTRLWSSFSGYSPRRYNNLCEPCSGQYRAEYYNNRYLSGNPALTRCEGWPINYNWGSNSPVTGINADNFSVRWLGTASFTAGTYTFIAYTDDGMKVWLDDTLIIDGWRDQGPTEYRTTRTVTAGLHRVRVDYYENTGGAVAQFRWVAPTTSSNLALNRTAWATSYQGTGYEPYRGNDGNTGTRWSSRIDPYLGDQWWRVDLGSAQTFSKVTIRWEAAYAASYFIGWSDDGTNFTGYWYTIGAPGAYTYSIGTHTNRYVAVLMRTRAPNMGNYSFWEFEVYNSTTATLDGEPSIELLPSGSLETIILPPTE